MAWNVYLAGEIHSDWRERIAEGAEKAGLDVTLSSPGQRPRPQEIDRSDGDRRPEQVVTCSGYVLESDPLAPELGLELYPQMPVPSVG